MKRPTKKPKEICENSSLFGSYESYTPTQLREIADYMDNNGILGIEFTIEGYDGYFECLQARMETKEEFEKRYNAEYKKWKQWKANKEQRKIERKEELIKEAKKLGLELKHE